MIFDTILSLIAPHACLVCQKEGSMLCAWCEVDAFPPIPNRCYHCKRLTKDSATCTSCKRYAPLRHVWVRTQYDGIPKQLLHQFKFERARAGVSIIASAMVDTLPYLPNILVVPVPTATSRVRQRGYDQSALLAREIAKNLRMSYQAPLVRLTQSRQVGADRKLRLTQLENAFFVIKPDAVRGKDILLVDDVMTTGATLQTVARVLKRAGAKSVQAVVFTQKQ